jgi:hypothetical protein
LPNLERDHGKARVDRTHTLGFPGVFGKPVAHEHRVDHCAVSAQETAPLCEALGREEVNVFRDAC